MDPFSIALGLAQFAPSIMRFFGAGEKSTAVVEKVVGVAQSVTGASTPAEALEMLRVNAAKQLEFQMAILAADNEMEKLYLADTQSARSRDVEIVKASGHNYRADSMFVLAVFLIAALVVVVLQSEIDEYAKGIITLVLGRFLGYLDNIYNFEFGTTRASKTKDTTIETLSKKGE
jgi:hypothetical protein